MTAPTPALAPVDWQRPWLAPYRESGQWLDAQRAAGTSVVDALNGLLQGTRHRPDEPVLLDAGPLCFVPQDSLPKGLAFESFVARSAQVPTREHLHDLFSGLVWLQQPALKRRLNQLQAAEIARDGIGPRRGAVRDALTRFDEHGALWSAPPPLWQALRDRDWMGLCVEHRALWSQARLQIVGHALLEQLARSPRKGLTAFVWAGGDAATGGSTVDAASAPAADWSGRCLLPLPVLGVPGWWPANEAPAFYRDATVFRRPKPLLDAGVAP